MFQANIKKEPAVGIIISCFGRGEPPDNARAFFSWVMSPERESEAGGKPLKGKPSSPHTNFNFNLLPANVPGMTRSKASASDGVLCRTEVCAVWTW